LVRLQIEGYGYEFQVGVILNWVGWIFDTSRVGALLLLFTATAAPAQQAQPQLEPTPPPPLPTIELPQNPANSYQMPDPTQGLIRVDVNLTDKAGRPVSGLSGKDFTLLDNDQKREIVTFQAFNGGIQPASSFEIIFVIDELNILPSVQNGKKELSQAAREVENILRANGGVLPKPAIIYRLSEDGLFATAHASMDGNVLAGDIENPSEQHRIWSLSAITKDVRNFPIGGAVGQRITQSIIALGSIAIEERRKPGRKLLFWIGNGWQIEGRRAAGITDFSVELLTRMREARINLWGATEWPLYDGNGNALPVTDYVDKEYRQGPKPDSTDLSYLSLPVIAARSGGGMLDVPRNLAARISERVKAESNYYSLTFDPPCGSPVDEYHHLKIEIDKPDLTVHAFQDYYDEPVFYDQPPLTHWVSVNMLQDVIAKAHDLPGAYLVQQFQGMELTERLSTEKLAVLQKQLRGKKEREALEVLADESVFLAPPPDEIPSTPPPDIAAQRQIISSTVSYVNNTIPRLPDFFATRKTVQYHELPPKPNQTWKTAFPDQSLYEGETATARLRFHDGKERVEDESVTNDRSLHEGAMEIPHLLTDFGKIEPPNSGSEQLRTIGTFGPILITVMAAATSPQGALAWSRWEKGADGTLAVFHYRVPQETPLFTAEFCCLANDFDEVRFKKAAPFHGEIAVDPSTGAILRLTIQADLEWRLPLDRSDVMVEYRPVQRGTRAFICPSRSVSISRQRRTMAINEWGEAFKLYAPFETLLNEMRFEKYRIFGSTSRILPGFVEVPEEKKKP
jgi:VWFA-related protein